VTVDAPVFGTHPPGVVPEDRPGAYGVVTDGTGRIAVLYIRGSAFLPGGGLEAGDDPPSALIREVREETGWACRIFREIGRAEQTYHSFDGNRWFRTTGYFFVADLTGPQEEPTEEDHRLVWTQPDDAVRNLRHEYQRWAVDTWRGTR
jgi:8-oxo-dGTP diphosphatase